MNSTSLHLELPSIKSQEDLDELEEKAEENTSIVVDLSIGGMTCSMCSNAIQQLFDGMEGITSSSISLATNLARIEFLEGHYCPHSEITLTPESIADEIAAIGYDVTDIILIKKKQKKPKKNPKNQGYGTTTAPQKQKVEVAIGGMTCSMCSSSVTKALQELPGVERVDVSLSTNLASIYYYDYDATTMDDECEPYNYPDDLQELIEEIGYDVTDVIHCKLSSSLTSSNTKQYRDEEEHDDDDFAEEEEEEPTQSEEENRLQRILKQQDVQLQKRRHAFLWAFAGTIPITTITMIIPHLFDEESSVRQFLNQYLTIFGKYTIMTQALILWLCATPVQFGCGYTFYKTSYHGLRRRILGMDVLVSIGTTASYVYAFMCMFSDHESHDQGYRFFETSAVLITFVLLGKWMNAAAVRQTSQALTQLMQMQPKTAIKIVPCQSIQHTKGPQYVWNPTVDAYAESVVSIQKIKPGDIVKVLRGANIPADGIVLHGELTVDQSMITGESIPVHKLEGEEVLGGTICSESSGEAAFIQVTGVGTESALSQIVSMVQDAQSKQVPIQNYADAIASVFVPVVVCFSLLTFLVWYVCCRLGIVPSHWYNHAMHEDATGSPVAFSLLFGIAALVISCPCALGLATPTAVMVGTGVGARNGILMKGGETLEAGSKVNAVIFDKTGTLTKGKPAVTDFYRLHKTQTRKQIGLHPEIADTDIQGVETNNSADFIRNLMDRNLSPTAGNQMEIDEYLIWLLGSLERNSEHILATAIVDYAERTLTMTKNNHTRPLIETLPLAQPSEFVAVTGRGVSGRIHNGSVSVAIGNRAFVEAAPHQMLVSQEAETRIQQLELEGKTANVVGINGIVCAILGIADELKDESSGTIQYLTNMGIDVWMVTGDSSRTAHAIAKQLQLPPDRVVADALPITKVEHVRKLQAQGDDIDRKTIVCMVGDGINDSPALVEADVGMSMGTGSDIAAEASDMVLVGGNITSVCTALHLSRTIFRRIQVNLVFSMLYNVVGIPVAAGIFFPIWHTRLPPTLAAVAMALSSISVVASSLALRLYRPPIVTRRDPSTGTKYRLPCLRFPGRQNVEYDKIAVFSDSDDDDRFLKDEEIV